MQDIFGHLPRRVLEYRADQDQRVVPEPGDARCETLGWPSAHNAMVALVAVHANQQLVTVLRLLPQEVLLRGVEEGPRAINVGVAFATLLRFDPRLHLGPPVGLASTKPR